MTTWAKSGCCKANTRFQPFFAYCAASAISRQKAKDNMNKISMMAITLAMSGCASVPSTKDIPAVTNFDASRYMGTWHEIARLPKWFERDLGDVTATYALDGETLQVTNRGTRNGKASVSTAVGHFAGDTDVGEFRVSFFRPFYGDYRIIWLSPGYDLALVTSSDRSALWILSREKNLPAERLDALIKIARDWRFNTAALEFP